MDILTWLMRSLFLKNNNEQALKRDGPEHNCDHRPCCEHDSAGYLGGNYEVPQDHLHVGFWNLESERGLLK